LNIDGADECVGNHAQLREYGVAGVVHDVPAVPLDGLGEKVENGIEVDAVSRK
jgi:hypothetical protein